VIVREPGMRTVHALPDQEPVEFPWSPCVYASWITEDLMRETEDK
jgi:hypothetical protein